MALLDRIKFDAESDDVLVWKYPSEKLRVGSQLIVNQSQEALFVRGGEVYDLFGPGTFTLTTMNLPLLSTLVNMPFGGETPFTAEVWFINKTVKRDLKWGTKSPIPIIEPKYNYPVNVRAFGQWGTKIRDSRSFIKQLVGTLSGADSARVEEYFIGEIVQRLSVILANFLITGGISIFEVNMKLDELSKHAAEAISPEFGRFGIEVVNFNIERITIPDDDMKRFQEIFAKKMEIEQISQTKVGQAYVTMRTFDALDKAGTAGSAMAGGLGLGMGVGAGMQVAKQMGQAMNPTAAAGDGSDDMLRLQKAKQLFDAGLITNEEFQAKKKEILDKI
ncbi:MAG: SPFH domain-containing protein [Candidatus Magnetominusculus sp. LBB02]|nr:SPFH domain-containing protein [Candidatus Magnetominusculus sp. LBB02]